MCTWHGKNIDEVLQVKTFSEPRMVVFANLNHSETAQAFVVAEKSVIFEINFTITKLIATYYPCQLTIQNQFQLGVFFHSYKNFFVHKDMPE